MPTFAYQARDKSGRKVAGTRDASDHHSALSDLRDQGLFVTQLAPVGRRVAAHLNGAAHGNGAAGTKGTVPSNGTVHPNGIANGNGAAPPGHPMSPVHPVPPVYPAPAGVSSEAPVEPSPQIPPSPSIPTHTITAPGREDILAGGPPPGAFRGAPASSEPRFTPGAHSAETAAPAKTMGPLAPPAPAANPWMRADAKQMSLFFRQIHAMINAGTTLGQALNSMGEHATNAALRQASKDMGVRTARGQLWSETMRTYPGLFSELMIGMISAGEMGGFLDRMCLRLAEYSERDYEIQQAIKRETWYPKLLVFMSILIPSAVPLVLAVVQPGKVSPLMAWLENVTPSLLVVGAVYGFWKCQDRILPVATHSGSPRYLLDMVKLCLPIAGKTARSLATAKFCRALGALQAAGAGLNQTITMAANACGNAVIAEHAKSIIPRVEHGEGLTDSLASTGYFPGIALQMLRTGEESGSIELQLDKVADFLEADAETTIKQSVQVLGIVVFMLIAIRIGIQVIQFYMGYANSLGSFE